MQVASAVTHSARVPGPGPRAPWPAVIRYAFATVELLLGGQRQSTWTRQPMFEVM